MKYVTLALAALTLGCGDDANVGDMLCSNGTTCQQVVLASPPVLQQVRTRDVPVLAPRWTKRELIAPDGVASASIATAANGLWVFHSDDATFVAKLVDSDGHIVGEQRLGPPDGADLTVPADLTPDKIGVPLVTGYATEHPLGPVVTVRWRVRCKQELCWQSEFLVFGNDAQSPATRVSSAAVDNGDGSADGIFRNAAGDALFVQTPGQAAMLDLRGNLLWKRRAPTGIAHSFSYGSPETSALVDRDGALVVALIGPAPNLNIMSPAQSIGVVLRQPADGSAPELFNYLADYSDGINLEQLIDLDDSGLAFLALDARGRRLIARTVQRGDVVVERLDGTMGDGFLLLREEYQNLTVTARAVDPLGTLYLTVLSGGREAAEQRTLLCAFPMEGAARCVAAAELFAADLAAPTPGVVYAFGVNGISRYDL